MHLGLTLEAVRSFWQIGCHERSNRERSHIERSGSEIIAAQDNVSFCLRIALSHGGIQSEICMLIGNVELRPKLRDGLVLDLELGDLKACGNLRLADCPISAGGKGGSAR